MSEMIGPLQEATIEELVDELGRRFDCVVLTGVVGRTSETEERLLQWRGSTITALGLTDFASYRLTESLAGSPEDFEDDDE